MELRNKFADIKLSLEYSTFGLPDLDSKVEKIFSGIQMDGMRVLQDVLDQVKTSFLLNQGTILFWANLNTI